MAVICGRVCHAHAAKPATNGLENDVPDALPHELSWRGIATVAVPKAQTLGFNRPSVVGPIEVNDDGLFPSSSMPPTEIILSASAGVIRVRHVGSSPSLPIELQTNMPLSAAMFAARLTTEVCPSISSTLYRSLPYPNELLMMSAPFWSAHSIACIHQTSSLAGSKSISVRANRNSAPVANPNCLPSSMPAIQLNTIVPCEFQPYTFSFLFGKL